MNHSGCLTSKEGAVESVASGNGPRSTTERKKNEILAKNANVTKNNNTAVKHSFPLSSYCLVLQFHLVLFPEMSASQPFRKGSGD